MSGKDSVQGVARQQQLSGFGRYVIESVGMYLAGAFAYSHRGKVKKEDFWRDLFDSTGDNQSVISEKEGYKKQPVPDDPYGALDFQACTKYISYAHKRAIRPEDSAYFRTAFQCDSWEYRNAAADSRRVRNKYMHITRRVLEGLYGPDMWDDIRRLRKLTDPIQRVIPGYDFNGLQPLEKFWENVARSYRERFGPVPVDVEELGWEVFGRTDALSGEQSAALESALDFYGLETEEITRDLYKGHLTLRYICSEASRGELLNLLKLHRPVAELLGQEWVSTPEEGWEAVRNSRKQREEEQKMTYPTQPLDKPLWEPAREDGRPLHITRRRVRLETEEIRVLLRYFNILLDESVLTDEAGCKGIDLKIKPVVREGQQDRRDRLKVDTSVPAALFRTYRENRPYTEEELAELEEDAQECAAGRAALREQSRTAIRTLKRLLAEGCLEIGPSLVDDERRYRNILRLAEKYPDGPFLVLTNDRLLAEELGRLYSRNGVAARIVKNEGTGSWELVIYSATESVWTEMMGPLMGNPPPAPPRSEGRVQQQIRAAAEQLRPDGPEERWVKAVFPNGGEERILLGSIIGEGGEGCIHAAETWDGQLRAVKIYHPAVRTPDRLEKLNYMLENDPGLEGLCWPCGMVYNPTGEWLGFLMPRAEGLPLSKTVYHPGSRGKNLTRLGWDRGSLARIAANVAELFAGMHRKGIMMADVNPSNVMVAQDCSVRFVDCDSYQMGRWHCPVGVVRYTPREIHLNLQQGGAYGLRTEENERYSIAVLLFEILMLGKAPYASRNSNNDDVVQAILEGQFPYPFHRDAVPEEEWDEDQAALERERLARRGLVAPEGAWRTIWSNTTYRIKEAFDSTFRNGERLSALEWSREMDLYCRMIAEGNSSAALIPTGYKVLKDMETESVTCGDCGLSFPMEVSVLEERRIRGKGKHYCPACRSTRRSMRARTVPELCRRCGEEFELPVWELRNPTDRVCPDCKNRRGR